MAAIVILVVITILFGLLLQGRYRKPFAEILRAKGF